MLYPYKLYSRISDHETVLELWGASTKHPDSIFYFSKFALCDWFPAYRQLFQWILECASKLSWPTHARDLCDFAIEVWNATIQEVV